jgi:hypothetical protein
MCFATIATVAGIAGGVATAGGTLFGALSQGQNASYQAAIARNNAIVEGYNAVHAVQAGGVAAENAGLRNAQEVGRVKTTLAASGIDVNSGSAVNAEESQREVGLLSEETVMNNAELQAYGYRTQAAADTSQSQLYESEAKQAPIAGILGAAGTLLGSAKAFAPSGGGAGGVNGVLSDPTDVVGGAGDLAVPTYG